MLACLALELDAPSYSVVDMDVVAYKQIITKTTNMPTHTYPQTLFQTVNPAAQDSLVRPCVQYEQVMQWHLQ